MSELNTSKIIDFHAHIFPDKIAEKAVESIGAYYGLTMRGKGTADDLCEKGKRIGVWKYLVHSTATKADQVRAVNQFIKIACREHDCFIGFGTLHPGLSDIEGEMERLVSLDLKGIKLHPEFQNFSIDDEAMMPIYRSAEGRLPILMHMGDQNKDSSSPVRLARVLDKFPQLTIIAAHLGGYRMWDEARRVLAGADIYYDTCSSLSFIEPDKAAQIIRGFGTDRVLFGTDYPMWDHDQELELIRRLALSPEEQEKILWKNAGRLLNIA